MTEERRVSLVTGGTLLAAALSIAGADVLIRGAYGRGSEPLGILALRFAVPALLFTLVVALRRGRRRERVRVTTRMVLALLLFGLLQTGSQLGEIHSLRLLPVALVVLVYALGPLWIGLISWLLWGVRVGRRGAAALVVAVSGTALVVGVPSENVSLLGFGFAAASGVAGAAALLVAERELRAVPPELTVGAGATIGVLVLLAYSPGAFDAELSAGVERALLVLGGGAGFGLAVYLILVGVRRSTAFVASLSAASEPIFAAVLAWLALSETVTLTQAAGGALAISGLLLGLRAPHPIDRRALKLLRRRPAPSLEPDAADGEEAAGPV